MAKDLAKMLVDEEVNATTPFGADAKEACDENVVAPGYNKWPLFWITVAISAILSIINIIGNGMVIFVSCRKKKTAALNNLNNAVRSLAIADLLFGIVVMPVIILDSYWGESVLHFVY